MRQVLAIYQQLLRAQLFPTTTLDPTTCCTFRVLEHFHLMTLQSKITAHDYYSTLDKLANGTGLAHSYVSNTCLLASIQMY